MKENVSGYSRNPCSLNRERDAASRHQPMNWRDSIWVQTSVSQWAFPMRSMQRLVPYSENKGYASNPRRFSKIVIVSFLSIV